MQIDLEENFATNFRPEEKNKMEIGDNCCSGRYWQFSKANYCNLQQPKTALQYLRTRHNKWFKIPMTIEWRTTSGDNMGLPTVLLRGDFYAGRRINSSGVWAYHQRRFLLKYLFPAFVPNLKVPYLFKNFAKTFWKFGVSVINL